MVQREKCLRLGARWAVFTLWRGGGQASHFGRGKEEEEESFLEAVIDHHFLMCHRSLLACYSAGAAHYFVHQRKWIQSE